MAIEIREVVVNNGSFGPKEIDAMVSAISADTLQLSALRDAVAELEGLGELTPASAVRLGIGYYLLGRYERAIDTLSRSDGGALAHFYLGQCYLAKSDWAKAIASFQSAAKAGYDAGLCQVAIAHVQRLSGDPKAALNWWLSNPDHRANLLNAETTVFGIAFVTSEESMLGGYFVVVSARP